ncbi:hypothetical protein KKE78_01485 [Patescibacteria group bacterium]|nr:hypothetical protein [Patescibacteria group bacterium]
MTRELLNITSYTSEAQTRNCCQFLISTRIARGFPQELGMEAAEYRSSFGNAIEDIVSCGSAPEGALLGLVDERIPFARQLELLGITLDPGIFYKIKHRSGEQPHAVWLKVFSPNEGPFLNSDNYQEAVTSLSACMRPATPFEGISTDTAAILARGFVSLPGGDYEVPGTLSGGSTRLDTLCLDNYLGKPRISRVRFAEMDYLVGMLAVFKQYVARD